MPVRDSSNPCLCLLTAIGVARSKCLHCVTPVIPGDCSKLTKFIRLADFHVRDTMLDLALHSLSSMSSWVNPDDVTAPVIRYKVLL